MDFWGVFSMGKIGGVVLLDARLCFCSSGLVRRLVCVSEEI